MQRTSLLTLSLLCLMSGVKAFADVVTLKDGRQISGLVESGNTKEIRINIAGNSQAVAVDQIRSVTFDPPQAFTPVVTPPPLPAEAQRIAAPIGAEPEMLGAVFVQGESGALIPLERVRATTRNRVPGLARAGTYWEMAGVKSTVRVKSGRKTMFVVRLANGIDPGTYSLYPLEVKKDSRRTSADPRNKAASLTLLFNVTKVGESSYGMTPAMDLAVGEYAFSPSNSNDAYCFGVDAPAVLPFPVESARDSGRVPSVADPNTFDSPAGATASVDERPTLKHDSQEASPAVSDRQAATPKDDSTDAIIADARSAASSFSADLPNLLAEQVTTRYVGSHNADNWRTQDVVTADVTSVGGKEDYRNIRVNGRPAERPDVSGSWSKGEFSSLLTDVLSPVTSATFTPRGEDRVANRSSWLFDLSVEQPRSHWTIQSLGREYKAAYRGTIWVDKESRRVLRIDIRAVNLPRDFPLDKVESSVQYGFVNIDGRANLLPARSAAQSCGGSGCSLNVIEFRNYRKF